MRKFTEEKNGRPCRGDETNGADNVSNNRFFSGLGAEEGIDCLKKRAIGHSRENWEIRVELRNSCFSNFPFICKEAMSVFCPVTPFLSPEATEESTIRHAVLSTHWIRLSTPTRSAIFSSSLWPGSYFIEGNLTTEKVAIIRSSIWLQKWLISAVTHEGADVTPKKMWYESDHCDHCLHLFAFIFGQISKLFVNKYSWPEHLKFMEKFQLKHLWS